MISDIELGWVARQNTLDRFAAAFSREDPDDEWGITRAELVTGVYWEDMSSSEKEYVRREVIRLRGF